MVSQNTSHVQGGASSAPTQDMNKEQYGSMKTTVAPTALTQNAGETSIEDISSQKATSTPQNWAGKLSVFPSNCLITLATVLPSLMSSNADATTPSKQPPWLSMSTSDSGNRTVNKNEKQALEDNTSSLSNAYSQGCVPIS